MLESCIRNFWKKKGLLNYLCLPLSCLYLIGFHIKFLFASPKKVNAKVICIGNITVGGAGKTPFCIALAKSLIKKGKKVAFISRGYKGSLSSCKKAVRINKKHSYFEVGDEPLLLTEIAPTYICKNRYKAAKLAVKDGADTIIMDDGLQNFTLQQDEKILIIDSNYGLGNNLTLPAGPLRESLCHALNRVTNIYVLGDRVPNCLKKYKPILCKYVVEDAKSYKGQEYVTMCGIANPDKFHATLKSLKVKTFKNFNFPDHFQYTSKDLAVVITEATKNKCKILTTTKDFLKIPHDMRAAFQALKISIKL